MEFCGFNDSSRGRGWCWCDSKLEESPGNNLIFDCLKINFKLTVLLSGFFGVLGRKRFRIFEGRILNFQKQLENWMQL